MKTLLGMRMSSALRGCCLAVAALAMACGTTSTSTTGTTGGATTGGTTTGGTTGLACFKVGTHCPNGTGCCTGETCDSNFYCVAASATTGGTTTGSATGGDPCVLSGAGGACGTSIDCQADLFCVNSLCTAPDTTQATCTQNGTGPTALAPCCETDANGACVQWQACTQQGRACADGGPVCCNGTHCGTDGTCDAVCGALFAACTQDSDCCNDQGFACNDGTPYNYTGKVCVPGLAIQAVGPSQPGYNYYCADVALCQAFDAGPGVIECQLDAICNYGDGGTNPCAQDGLTCDQNYNVCRNPGLFDQCDLGGPPCETFGGTTSPMICSPAIFGQVTPTSVCTFACTSSSDCAEPFMSCITQNGYDVCTFSNDATVAGNNCGPGNFNGVCNSSAGDDGVCVAGGGDAYGVCIQAFTDGDGGPQTVCNINGNRQIGGLCDTLDICTGNLCQPVCNASDSQSASRGGCATGQRCLTLLSAGGIGIGPQPSTDTDTAGACVTACDFLDAADAGTCGVTASGAPTRCLPAEELGYTTGEGPDFCVASAGANAIPLGGDCSKPVGDSIDACVDGAICLGRPAVCQQLCEDGQLGKAGALGGCQAGYTCTALNFTNTASTHTGACLPVPDGG